jgi:hypothetical protein
VVTHHIARNQENRKTGDRRDVILVISSFGADPGGLPDAFGEFELARFYLFSQKRV